ncbi:MAG TPA: MFS transporter [Hyphomicrobiaceae bacterium]|nr:MFS transporter [Hyphomicrobiaceae bacterium]
MNGRIDSREAWLIAVACLLLPAVSFGAQYVAIVALAPIAADFGGYRSVPAAAASLVMLGTGLGGLAMGQLAERIGTRLTVAMGGLMMCAGMVLSAMGQSWQLYVGHGLLVGFFGNGAINAPLYVYITRWFERRRGTALALIASGQYVAGALWPSLFERSIAAYGWQQTMAGFGVIAAILIVPIAALALRPPPVPAGPHSGYAARSRPDRVLDLPPNAAFALLAAASFLCCIPMAMPAAHLIALCGDLGLKTTTGALMLSVLLTCAFVSRQLWGWLSDRVGGLNTLLLGSLAQATAIAAFVFTQTEAGLFTVAAVFGLGFSGLIPAYILAARQLFPAHEASWRMPTLLLTGMSGMAAGSSLAGAIYDYAGFYAPAFAVGLAFNLANLCIIGSLVLLGRKAVARASAA